MNIPFILKTGIFFCLLSLFYAEKSAAASYSVTNLDDSGAGSFRQALTDANSNAGRDTINFSLSGMLIISSALPSITDSLVINGHENGNTVKRDFINPAHRILDISNGSRVVINRLTLLAGSLMSGNGAGLLVQSNSVVEMNNCCIRNCFANAPSQGGGIYVQSQAKLTLINCTVSDNSMSSAGGGGMVCDFNSDVTLIHCTFSHNTAGAILNYSNSLKMTNTILANSSPASTPDFTNSGGAVSVNNNNIVELCASGTNCAVFFSNNDPGLGNLMINDGGPTETRAIENSSIAYNAGFNAGIATDQNGNPRDATPDIGAYEVATASGTDKLENDFSNKCSESDLGTFNLSIIDLSGRIIFDRQYDAFWQTAAEIRNIETNSYNLNSGIYILKMSTNEKICLTRMISAH